MASDSLSCHRGPEAGRYGAQGRAASWHLPSLGHPATSVCWAWLPFQLLFDCQDPKTCWRREEGAKRSEYRAPLGRVGHEILATVSRPERKVRMRKVTDPCGYQEVLAMEG